MESEGNDSQGHGYDQNMLYTYKIKDIKKENEWYLNWKVRPIEYLWVSELNHIKGNRTNHWENGGTDESNRN